MLRRGSRTALVGVVAILCSQTVTAQAATAQQLAGAPTVAIADAQVFEPAATLTTTAAFKVKLSSASGGTVTVDYATEDGTATAPANYLASSGTLTFAPGVKSRTIRVLVNGDGVFTGSERFLVVLSTPSGASLGRAQASVQIIEHDTLFLPVKGRLGDVAVNPASTLAFVANIDKNEIEVVDLLTHTLQRPIPVGF